MSPAPKRRRRPAKRDSSSIVPLVALFVGVVVAGLAIGAALSYLGTRNASTPRLAYATPSPVAPTPEPSLATYTPVTPRPVTPQPAPSAAPTAAATRTPATPTPEPSSAVTAEASATASASASASPVATAPTSAVPRATASATVVPTANATPLALAVRPSGAPHAVPTPPRAALVTPHAAPSPRATAASVAAVGPPAAPHVAAEGTTSAFSRAASDVVRQYLAALMAGDEATARDALVDGRGDLTEEAVLDRNSRIHDFESHGTADTAEVTCTILTPAGDWGAHFFLVKSAAGNPQIRSHDIVRQS